MRGSAPHVHDFVRGCDDYRSPCLLAMIYKSLGDKVERQRSAKLCLERAERTLEQHPENASPAALGTVALAHLGLADRAREWADRALAIEPDDTGTQYNVACAYSVIGDHEKAFDLLDRVVENSTLEQALWIPHESDLDPLRTHARYNRLLEKLERARRSEPSG